MRGDSIKTVSSRPGSVGAYTIWATGTLTKKIYVLLFNKDESTRHVDVLLTSQAPRGTQPALYRLDAAGLYPVNQTVSLTSQGFGIDLPARSATMVILQLR